MPLRRVAFVIGACLSTATPSSAGFVTPFDIPEAPTIVLAPTDIRQGFQVPQNALVDVQYAESGLQLSTSAIGRIDGVPVWVPTGGLTWGMMFPMWDPEMDGKLNFRSWDGKIAGGFVIPGTTYLATVTQLQVEIIGGDPGAVVVAKYDWNGNLIQSGSDSRIDYFEVYTAWNPMADWENPTPWGIASISFDTPLGFIQMTPPTPPVATPEPGTLALAAVGLFGASFAAFRRRRGSAISV